MSSTAGTALERTDTGVQQDTVPQTYPVVPKASQPGRVAAWRTRGAGRKDTPKVACTECGTEHPPNKSGLCVKCWRLSDWPSRNARAKRGQGEPRKRDPEEQWAMAARFARRVFANAEEEDVESGLAYAVQFAEQVNAMVKALGEHKVAEHGPSYVAGGLGWDKRRAWKRWGAGDEPA